MLPPPLLVLLVLVLEGAPGRRKAPLEPSWGGEWGWEGDAATSAAAVALTPAGDAAAAAAAAEGAAAGIAAGEMALMAEEAALRAAPMPPGEGKNRASGL